MKLTKLTILTGALAASLLTLPVSAQEAQPGGDRGDRRRDFNPEEFRQRMAERLKSSLKVSDEEWGIIQPLIEKVTTKQREARGGFGFGGRGGRGPGGDSGSQSAAGTASQALRTTLENESASPEEIKAKLSAVRDARKKAQSELDAAREELRKVLTVRQEAALVSMGILE
jgi:hypothetical protein